MISKCGYPDLHDFSQMIIAADNLRITNPTIASALHRLDPEPIQALVQRCEAAGADWIDINPGPLTHDPEKKMAFLVDAACSVTRLPLLLDTTNPRALAAGLAFSRNPTIINGFSLEPRKLTHILPLARQYRCDIIGFVLYPNSQVPIMEKECISVLLDLYRAFEQAGLEDHQLIIDPVVTPILWADGARHNKDLLSIIRNLPDLLGFPVRTIAGLSNLSAGNMPKTIKQLLQCTFLPLLVEAGVSCVLIDVSHPPTVQTARASHALLNTDVFSWAALPKG
jgi:5-methyltetrahydrofolate corrinoid/iron sulfur protein methyltransferase